jgi:hypothetical protein
MPEETPEPGAPTDVTLVEVLAELAESGYEVDFFVEEETGQVCCSACRSCQDPDAVALEGMRRLEGASDPADMAVVLAIRCPSCDRKGTAIIRFGPEASAGEAMVLRNLDDVRPTGLDVAEDAAS